MSEDQEFQMLLDFFKILGNEARLKILGLVANREYSVEELATLLKLREPTISHHLNKMKKLGLVTMRAEGNTHLYQLNRSQLLKMNKELLTVEKVPSMVNDIDYEGWEKKVMNTFVENGKIKTFPASQKKRMVLVKWVLNNFEEGKKYPEQELNGIIKEFNPDCATIRRSFVENGWMRREKGVYWRTGIIPKKK